MEASTIDFYDHPNRCSGKCQSRNYVNAPTDEAAQARKNKRATDAIILKTEIENEIAGKDSESGDRKTSMFLFSFSYIVFQAYLFRCEKSSRTSARKCE